MNFKSAYKRLLIRHEIRELENGNAIYDGIDILHVSSKKTNFTCSLEHNLVASEFDHDYIKKLYDLSPFIEEITEYISGFVCRKIDKNLHCEECKLAIYGRQEIMPALSKLKSYNSYYKSPSKDRVTLGRTINIYLQRKI
ncbi:hypothetical protein ABEB36_001295 [Hypothenemus hampei]|uniref:Uncharacterized protein n=1 Tax=Hypothenemus hampei TaxID=57062 RepID=A0ABD1FE39_HYPHA